MRIPGAACTVFGHLHRLAEEEKSMPEMTEEDDL